MRRFLLSAEEGVVRTEKALVVLLVFLMTALSFLQVLLRVLFHSGIVWLDPLLRHMVLWAGLLGAALASRYNRQFALEALVKFAPPAWHRPLAAAAGLFTAGVSGALFYAAWKFLRDESASGSTAFFIGHFAVKGFWAELILPGVFALIIFHTVAGFLRPEEKEEGPAA